MDHSVASAKIDIETVKQDVDTLLQDFCDARLAQASLQDAGYAELWRSISELVHVGGKRMRPYLTMLAYDIYGGTNYASVLYTAAAQELLHLSMLIHDDIIDRDDIRYGIDNVSGKYAKKYLESSADDGRHYATGAAILAGDAVLSSAYMMILESPLDAGDKVYAAQTIGRSVFAVVGGELRDMESIFHPFGDIDTLAIAQYKTSIYSFVGPLLCGAGLAMVRTDELDHLEEFGINVGIAFQLADDMLGVFGDENITGKSAMSDLTEGKRTYMMQYAFNHADAQQKVVLDELFGNEAMSQEQADTIRDIIRNSGAVEATEQCIQEYAERARVALSKLSIGDTAAQPLHELILKSTKRDK